jgi:hypothetical protein
VSTQSTGLSKVLRERLMGDRRRREPVDDDVVQA